MPADQQIQINTLLLTREELFVRVYALEQAAAAILGEPYPFTRPALPSDIRLKRKPTPRLSERSGAFNRRQPPAKPSAVSKVSRRPTASPIVASAKSSPKTIMTSMPSGPCSHLKARTSPLPASKLSTSAAARKPC